MSTLLVTAANDEYFPLLRGLLRSLRDCPQGASLAVSVLDLGLTTKQVAWLNNRVHQIVEPGWDLSFPNQAEMGKGFQAMTARPFLPEHFPDFEYLFWMDADAWVQQGSALDDYQAAAQSGGLAITPEMSRCYDVTFDPSHAVALYRSFKDVYSKEVAESFGFNPILNSGVFCAHRDAPHWDAWKTILEDSLQHTQNFYIEQYALNVAVYHEGLPTNYLPATHNWMCHHSTPSYDDISGTLVEPFTPHETLSVIHLTVDAKEGPKKVSTLDGNTNHIDLTYENISLQSPQPASGGRMTDSA